MHRDEEYPESNFAALAAMQSQHFWYRGRHRFILHSVKAHLGSPTGNLRAIDLGAGCGGWIHDLRRASTGHFAELAAGDSSSAALEFCAQHLGEGISVHHIDLLELPWRKRWDVAFLLDVVEHIPDDRTALAQVRDAVVPGGLVFVTVPAFQQFWTWNDDAAGHQRRYTRSDFERLAEETSMQLVDARYFMFFLSPLLVATRLLSRSRAQNLTDSERRELAMQAGRQPNRLLNDGLRAIFCTETPLGHHVRFPWGTSLLGVFRRPEST